MTLRDCDVGDWVVVDEGDRVTVLEFGARLFAFGTKKARQHTSALVTDLERDTFTRHARSARIISLDTPVLDVVATAAWRRVAFAGRRAYISATTKTGDGDPLAMRRRGGTF